jgi:hypothetical protein
MGHTMISEGLHQTLCSGGYTNAQRRVHQAPCGGARPQMGRSVAPPARGALDVAADSAIMHNIVPHTSFTETLQKLRTHSLNCKGGGPRL